MISIQLHRQQEQKRQQEATNAFREKKNQSLGPGACYNDSVKSLTGKSKSDLTALIISGSIGSLMTSFVVTPLEVAKIRIQASATESLLPSSLPSTRIPVLSNNIVQQPSPSVGAYSSSSLHQTLNRNHGIIASSSVRMDCVSSKRWFSHTDPYIWKQNPNANVSATTSVMHSGASAGIKNTHLGTCAMLRRIFVEEGYHGLYAGLRPTLIMAIPNTVIYYSAYEEIVWQLRQFASKFALSTNESKNNGLSTSVAAMLPLLAGGSARLISSSVTVPLELLRTRQAAGTGTGLLSSAGIWQDFKYIIQNEGGISSLYKGFKPTLYRDVPFSAIYWLCIEQFRNMWKSKQNCHDTSPFEQAGQSFASGVVAGMIAAAFTTPFDVIKTRQQARCIERTSSQTISSICYHPKASLTFSATEPVVSAMMSNRCDPLKTEAVTNMQGTWRYFRYVARTEGMSALWRGNQARMIKAAISCSIIFSSYELGNRLMQNEN